MSDTQMIARARAASWVAIALLVLGLMVEVGAGLVLDHYAAQGRGNNMRALLVAFWVGDALVAGSFAAGIVAVARRRRHWTTWTVLAIIVLSAAAWFVLPGLLRPLSAWI